MSGACQFIKFETFAQWACFQCINTDPRRLTHGA